VLVSTHYMDEAERCHRIAYIAYGKLMARGTVDEVIEGSGLSTFRGLRPGRRPAGAMNLAARPGVEMVAPSAPTLHVSGSDGGARRRGRALQGRRRLEWSRCEPTLEDVFIHLMDQSQDNFEPGTGREGAAASRWAAWAIMILKEFIQLTRDRLTFAMMVGMPIIQLLLFGYAINADPRNLPTAVLGDQDRSQPRSWPRRCRTAAISASCARCDTAEVDRLLDRAARCSSP
jgi:hypothetical protein